jgi:thiamine monophosphate synthase
VDEASIERVCEAAAAVCPHDVLVMARAKGEDAERRRVGHAVARACRRRSLPFSINGDEALFLETSATWFHAPGSVLAAGLRGRLEGRSGRKVYLSRVAHDHEDVLEAVRTGLDAAVVSPIFEVPEKGPPRGIGALEDARRLAPALGLVALGGIDPPRAASCLLAGADAVAVMRAAFVASRPEDVLRELHFATRARSSKC